MGNLSSAENDHSHSIVRVELARCSIHFTSALSVATVVRHCARHFSLVSDTLRLYDETSYGSEKVKYKKFHRLYSTSRVDSGLVNFKFRQRHIAKSVWERIYSRGNNRFSSRFSSIKRSQNQYLRKQWPSKAVVRTNYFFKFLKLRPRDRYS